MSLWAILLTGLTTGGLTCLAVQGGLLAGYLASRRYEGSDFHWKEALVPTGLFLMAKLVAYTLVGLLLGYVGSFLQLSIGMRVVLQTTAGLFMLLAALKLFFPGWRFLGFRAGSGIRQIIRSTVQKKSNLVPVLLGLTTVFIPCGTTQAMEALAIASGSTLQGGLIMGLFTLGTFPLFFLVGVVARGGARVFQGRLAKATAVMVLLLGLYSLNGAIALSGSSLTVQTLVNNWISLYRDDIAEAQDVASIVDGSQEVTLNVLRGAYDPREIVLTSGVPARLRLVTNGTRGCTRSFTIPSLGFQTVLQETGEKIVEFTPEEPGKIVFTCSMGMFSGVINVVGA